MIVEKRFFHIGEIRADAEDRSVKGYAAVFNAPAEIFDRFLEEIAPGAFAESVANGDVRALWSHNVDLVIGRTKNGSLQLREDAHGLAFDLKLPDTNPGRDAYELISKGFVTGMSFGFRVKEQKWTKGENGAPHKRTLMKVELLEVSPTAFPAYEQTYVSKRDEGALAEEIKKIETEWAFEEKEREKSEGLKTEGLRRKVEKWERENSLLEKMI